MKTSLILVGKTTNKHIAILIDDYISRLSHYNLNFSISYVPDIKYTKGISDTMQKAMESIGILKLIQPGDFVVLLDEHGKEYTSKNFAKWLNVKMNVISKRLVFIIGGPYGFSDDVYLRANEQISLSQMTFSHQMVRLFFIEQLYRGMTILKGEHYHHD